MLGPYVQKYNNNTDDNSNNNSKKKDNGNNNKNTIMRITQLVIIITHDKKNNEFNDNDGNNTSNNNNNNNTCSYLCINVQGAQLQLCTETGVLIYKCAEKCSKTTTIHRLSDDDAQQPYVFNMVSEHNCN